MGVSIVQPPPPKKRGRQFRLPPTDIKDLAEALASGNSATADTVPVAKRATANQRGSSARKRVEAEHGVKSKVQVWPSDKKPGWLWALMPVE